MDEQEKKLEKEMEFNTIAFLRGIFRLVCFVAIFAAVISVIWAKWYAFRVCLTILSVALAILVIREWWGYSKDSK